MFIDIECVFELHLDGSEVQLGEEPRAKREWLNAIRQESLFAIVEEVELSPNNNYQFRITSNEEYYVKLLLRKWYFGDDPTEAEAYFQEFANQD